jgi:hypothetical protein
VGTDQQEPVSAQAPVYWVIPGKLAGMAFPFLHPERRLAGGGAVDAFEDDLPLLRHAGIRAVVSLVNSPSDRAVYATAGLGFLCLPIPDGWPPTAEQVDAFVEFADRIIASGGAVVVHCHAGLGRTGTMLAAYLIRHGMTAVDAIRTVRQAEPAAIETTRQVQFLQFMESRGACIRPT